MVVVANVVVAIVAIVAIEVLVVAVVVATVVVAVVVVVVVAVVVVAVAVSVRLRLNIFYFRNTAWKWGRVTSYNNIRRRPSPYNLTNIIEHDGITISRFFI